MFDVKLGFGLDWLVNDANREADDGEMGTDLKEGEEVSPKGKLIDVSRGDLCDMFGVGELKALKLSPDIADDRNCSSMLGCSSAQCNLTAPSTVNSISPRTLNCLF